jgi:ribosomal protein L37AE/L43A
MRKNKEVKRIKEICPACQKAINSSDRIWLCRQTKRPVHLGNCSMTYQFALNSVELSPYKDNLTTHET